MRRISKVFLAVLIFIFVFALTGCDIVGGGSDSEKYDDQLEASTGCWKLMGDEDTYFQLDGSRGVMSFTYYEDGTAKYSGTYRAIYKGTGKDVTTPFTLLMTRADKDKEDWLSCYTDCFENDFTQFTIMVEEEDLGFIDGTVYTHIYRISEMPYKMGTYILDGNEYKPELNNYSDGDSFNIPNGTYTLETGESFTFLYTKPKSRQLFSYKNGDEIIEGTISIAQDKKTIYLYIEHDPYSKVTKADKDKYDTNIYYPPDFYLRGDFSSSDCIVINDLYHHSNSPTEIQDSVWTFGTYAKQ